MARLIVAHPRAVPLDAVLPVLMAALPLRRDYLEYAPVVEVLMLLLREEPTKVGSVGWSG